MNATPKKFQPLSSFCKGKMFRGGLLKSIAKSGGKIIINVVLFVGLLYFIYKTDICLYFALFVCPVASSSFHSSRVAASSKVISLTSVNLTTVLLPSSILNDSSFHLFFPRLCSWFKRIKSGIYSIKHTMALVRQTTTIFPYYFFTPY